MGVEITAETLLRCLTVNKHERIVSKQSGLPAVSSLIVSVLLIHIYSLLSTRDNEMTRLTATFLDTRPQPLPGSLLPLSLPRGGGECPARLCLVAVVAVVSVLPVLRLGGSADQTAGLPEEGGL